jgi:hypothetical protein
MKPDFPIIALLVSLVALAGCASDSKPKATHERGWIGGDYRAAGRNLRPPGKNPRVYLHEPYPDTPSMQAGLRAGDMVEAIDGKPVTTLRNFRTRVDAATPGQTVTLNILREGQDMDVPVTVGCERYQQWNSVSLGFSFSTEFDLFPNPDFWLGPIGGFKRTTEQKELNSPESKLEKAARKPSKEAETGVSSSEGWNMWLVIFGFNQYKTILAQERVTPQ